jgi:hypothetical protein
VIFFFNIFPNKSLRKIGFCTITDGFLADACLVFYFFRIPFTLLTALWNLLDYFINKYLAADNAKEFQGNYTQIIIIFTAKNL